MLSETANSKFSHPCEQIKLMISYYG